MEKCYWMGLRLPDNSGLDWFCRLVEGRYGATVSRLDYKQVLCIFVKLYEQDFYRNTDIEQLL